MDKLTREVKEFARQIGADLVGIAGKECFGRIPTITPDELLSGAQSVVVMALRKSAYALFPGGTWNSQEHYVGRLALEMNVLLRTSNFLEDKGFQTYPVSHHGHLTPRDVSLRESIKYLSVSKDGELQGVEEFKQAYLKGIRAISHMHLAEEAGLGEIGHCKLLVTPRFGPQIGLVSLITDAPLEPDKKMEEPVCKKDECNKCVEYCRSGALKPDGGNMAKCMFQMGSLPSVDVIKRGDKTAIEQHLIATKSLVFGFERGILRAFRQDTDEIVKPAGGCGMCVVACPVGRRHEVKPRLIYGTPSVSMEVL